MNRIALCALASIAGHVVLGEALATLPERAHATRPRKIEVRVVEPPPPPPPPPPEPEPVPEPPPPTPSPRVVEKPRIARTPSPPTPQPPAPPTTSTTTSTEPTARPVFGVTMESTSTAGSTAVPVGNTASPSAPRAGSATVPPAPPPPAPAHEVTKLPLPRGRCAGKYTDAAREAGVEGVVVLDLVVGADGRAQNITVVERLPHGLTEAAIAALEACRFDPGERAGVPVAVRVRGFKIRFLLDER